MTIKRVQVANLQVGDVIKLGNSSPVHVDYVSVIIGISDPKTGYSDSDDYHPYDEVECIVGGDDGKTNV